MARADLCVLFVLGCAMSYLVGWLIGSQIRFESKHDKEREAIKRELEDLLDEQRWHIPSAVEKKDTVN